MVMVGWLLLFALYPIINYNVPISSISSGHPAPNFQNRIAAGRRERGLHNFFTKELALTSCQLRLVFVLCYQVPQSLIFKDSAALMFLSGSVLIHQFMRKWCRNWCSKEQMLMCRKVTHKNLRDSSPLFFETQDILTYPAFYFVFTTVDR